MSKLTKLSDLKIGDKFYNYDNLIYVIHEKKYDVTRKDFISFRLKRYKEKYYIPQTINSFSGLNCTEQEYYKFTRRDEQSFMAGFRMAVELCTQHMGKFDLENSGLDNDMNRYITRQEAYAKWKKNI